LDETADAPKHCAAGMAFPSKGQGFPQEIKILESAISNITRRHGTHAEAIVGRKRDTIWQVF
jgi:hypothetical protein